MEEIIKLYEQGKSIPDIAKMYATTPLTIYEILKENGIKFRRGGWRPNQGRKKSLPSKLTAPVGGPTKPKESETSKWWNTLDSLMDPALKAVADALRATKIVRYNDEYIEVEDHKIRLEAAKLVIDKRIPDVRSIEHKGFDGGPIEIVWAGWNYEGDV